MIVGTAGHIDHGKTSLVKALTGVDADRLPEEKARGITLDLGYAYTPLPGGGILGFVDVPGHERLIHNMLAGATGIDYALLVVAADDGPMPQTREHLQILELLGLLRGAIALTKIDMVAPERAEAARQEVHALLAGTGLREAPIFALSSVSGQGVAELRAHLDSEARALPSRGAHGHFRLAVDRCFTLKGAGTIVTGTVYAGRVRVGDELVLSPPGIAVRVRSIHAQDRPAEEGVGGQRCALNLAGPGFERNLVERGHWVLEAPVHAPVQRLDLRLRVLDSEPRALRHWTPVHFHLGAADVPGRIALLEGDTLEPGGSALAQAVLDRPIGALSGDRFVIRDQSATRTIGGGRVLDPFPPLRGRRTAQRLALLRAYEGGDAAAALTAALAASPLGVDLARFAQTWNLPGGEARDLYERMSMRRVEAGALVWGFSAQTWEGLRARLIDALNAEHERSRDMIGVGRERLRRLAAPALLPAACDAALEELLREGGVVQSGVWLHRPDHQLRLTPNEEKLWSKVQPLLEVTPFHPPRVRDISLALPMEEEAMRQLLKRLSRLGEVYPVAHDHYFTRRAVTELAHIVRELQEQQGDASAASFRDRIQTGRKLAIQILEFFDRIGYTRRVGDAHRLRQTGLFAEEVVAAPVG
jgi:selenocysteine-specific elongation factor